MGTVEASGAEPRWSRANTFLTAPLGTKIHLCTKFQVSTFYGFRWAVLSQSNTTSPFINMGNLEASGAEPRWSRAKSFLSAPLGTKIHPCTKFQVSTFYGFRWAVLSQLTWEL